MAAKRRGVPRSDETKAKVSAAKTGKKRGEFSEEWKTKLGDSMRGKEHSPESIEKMREARRQWHARKKARQANAE